MATGDPAMTSDFQTTLSSPGFNCPFPGSVMSIMLSSANPASHCPCRTASADASWPPVITGVTSFWGSIPAFSSAADGYRKPDVELGSTKQTFLPL